MQRQDMASRARREAIDAMVLTVLVQSRAPWSVDEVGRQFELQGTAGAVVDRLAAAGLVDRLGALVFPTRAGVRAAKLPLSPPGRRGSSALLRALAHAIGRTRR